MGNVFLAGDAAHQTPPFFGQGMCHGLRDVANLAWKMAAVAQDKADPAILDTYQGERDPHVRGVIGAAVAAGRYICELDPIKADERDAQIRAAAAKSGETAADLIPAMVPGWSPRARPRVSALSSRCWRMDAGWTMRPGMAGAVCPWRRDPRPSRAWWPPRWPMAARWRAGSTSAARCRAAAPTIMSSARRATGVLALRAQMLGLNVETAA
jgi:hypothetical protein